MEENKLSINYLFRSFKRNFGFIIYFIVCFFAIGSVFTVFFNKPSYKSQGVLATTNINYIQTMKEVVDNETYVANIVHENIIKSGKAHEDNSLISSSEIKGGITATAVGAVPQLKIEFTNSDSSIVKDILDEVLKVSQDAINKLYTNYNVRIASSASDPVNVSKSNVKIVGLFTIAGAFIGALSSIITEIRKNLLYEPADIETIDFKVFEITYDKENGANEII